MSIARDLLKFNCIEKIIVEAKKQTNNWTWTDQSTRYTIFNFRDGSILKTDYVSRSADVIYDDIKGGDVMNRYQLQNAVEKIVDYYAPPHDAHISKTYQAAFDAAKEECLTNLKAALASVEHLTVEQFFSVRYGKAFFDKVVKQVM